MDMILSSVTDSHPAVTSAPTDTYTYESSITTTTLVFPDQIGCPTRNPVSCIRGSTSAPYKLQLSLRAWLNHTLERLGVASEKLPWISWLPLNTRVKNRNDNAPN